VNENSADQATGGRQRRAGAFVLVPAATFLVGLLLGAALVWVAQPSDGDRGGAPDVPASPGAGPSPSPTRPGETASPPASGACLRAARAAEDLVRLAREAAAALADLDTQRLQEIVSAMEELDRRIRPDAQECRGQL